MFWIKTIREIKRRQNLAFYGIECLAKEVKSIKEGVEVSAIVKLLSFPGEEKKQDNKKTTIKKKTNKKK